MDSAIQSHMKLNKISNILRRSRGFLALALLAAFTRNANAKISSPRKPIRSEALVATTATPTSLLDRIVCIAAERPFQPAAMEKLAELPLVKSESESNDYYTIYHSTVGKSGPLFAKVEVRSPRLPNHGKGGMVIADLGVGDLCIKREDVDDRFGKAQPSTPTPLSPHAPQDAPRYENYKQPWGIIRLGFSRQTGCLATVILDAT